MTEKEIEYIENEGYEFIKEFHKNGHIYITVKHLYCGKVYNTRKEAFIKVGQRCSCQRRHGAKINTIADAQNFINNKFGRNKYTVLSEKYLGRKAPIILKEVSTGIISKIPAFDRILDKRLLTLKNYFELADKDKHYIELLDNKCIKLYGHKKFEVLDYCSSNWYAKYKSTFKCLSCGQIFERKASDILRTCRCPLCENEAPKNLTIDDVKQEFAKVDKKSEYELLSTEYISTHDLLLVRHKKCGHEYRVSRTNFLAGRRCPYCVRSKSEEHIEELLESLSISYEYQKRFDGLKHMPFDFYIPSINTAIEYDGEFHYLNIYGDNELKRQQAADKVKNEFCKNNSINLIRIPYWEKDKIDTIISNILK